MRFMMIIKATKESEAGKPINPELAEAIGKSAEQMFNSGAMIATGGLMPSSKGARIRVSGGKLFVTDGPFAETREQLGGYFLIEAGSVGEAIDIAARIPGARIGTIEVRPILELPGLPGLKR